MSDYIIAALCLLSALAINLHLDQAKQPRLMGKCNEKIERHMEEDQFPHGCQFIVSN